ncbi:type IX secretion system protein PorQ [Flavihumibacter sp. RY-1]|uniref:Type IX secretion system protein PorQ n=1 Tax=Flavihumibacter fluminis TaxID=2909236 RepID=A0ABS9BD73_9BACT|nr:type IX secretion system protein PorQ [Flavihumibacter fluminis]MCF1713525.1 type IX secretion system protein PorQ [Flavihumibacter fluminis]
MQLLKSLIIFLSATYLVGACFTVQAQTAGGQSIFSFLRLPTGAQQSSVGGETTSLISRDLGIINQNPALLRPTHHSQFSLSFTPMPAGIKQYYLSAAVYKEKIATSFAAQVQYIGYGSIPQTDPSGNELGNFNPRDYQVQLTASRRYLDKWYYGGSLQFIQSNYGAYRSSGMAITLGMNYYDSSRQFQAGLVMKHMGVQLSSFVPGQAENLPFELQAGITKRLSKAPLQFSVTLRDLHRLILYKPDSTISTADQVFQHLVLGAQAFIGDKIELGIGYNHLRRRELSIANTSNGFTGFSFGAGLLLNRFQFRYARSFYTNVKGYHQVSVNYEL